MEVHVLGFEVLKELYNYDLDFGHVWKYFFKGSINHFLFIYLSKTIDCASINVLCKEQLFKKLMEEVLLDTLEETKLLILCKKIFVDPSWLMMVCLLWELAEPTKLLRATVRTLGYTHQY